MHDFGSWIFVGVADGIGSDLYSEWCSREVIDCLSGWLPLEVDEGAWTQGAEKIAHTIGQFTTAAWCSGMRSLEEVPGTTLTAAWLRIVDDGIEMRWINIGDSAVIALSSPDANRGMSVVSVFGGSEQACGSATACIPYAIDRVDSGIMTLRAGDCVVLATDGYLKQLEDDPELCLNNLEKIIRPSVDPALLLLALRHDGPGFDDDASAALIVVS